MPTQSEIAQMEFRDLDRDDRKNLLWFAAYLNAEKLFGHLRDSPNPMHQVYQWTQEVSKYIRSFDDMPEFMAVTVYEIIMSEAYDFFKSMHHPQYAAYGHHASSFFKAMSGNSNLVGWYFDEKVYGAEDVESFWGLQASSYAKGYFGWWFRLVNGVFASSNYMKNNDMLETTNPEYLEEDFQAYGFLRDIMNDDVAELGIEQGDYSDDTYTDEELWEQLDVRVAANEELTRSIADFVGFPGKH